MSDEVVSVKGYEALYAISSAGGVLSYAKKTNNRYRYDRWLKPSIAARSANSKTYGGTGYSVVQLFKDKKYKSFHVHRLVAEHFIPNPNEYPQVNHIDGNKQNNAVENLEWCTAAQNMRHAAINGLFKREKVVQNVRSMA